MKEKRPFLVITPLHDPTGTAFTLFSNCAESVLAQIEVDFIWQVSVQEASHHYFNLFETLGVDHRVTIVQRPEVTNLHDHLSAILLGAPPSTKIHILCQDDFYTHRNSLKNISVALQSRPVIKLRPAYSRNNGNPARPIATTSMLSKSPSPLFIESKWSEWLDESAVNRFGGLSSVAFLSDLARNMGELQFDLFIDLEIRNQLRCTTGPLWEIREHLVCESIWPGQSQRSMQSLHSKECKLWVMTHQAEFLDVLVKIVAARAYGNDMMAHLWRDRLRQKPRPIQVLVPAADLLGTALSALVKVAHKLRQLFSPISNLNVRKC